MQKITIMIDSDADPSELLDAALQFAEELSDEFGGSYEEDDISVEEVD